MNIDDLSATDLAKIDAICLQYEADLRHGRAPTIDSIVKHIGGEHSELLRSELSAIHDEIQEQGKPQFASVPFQIPALQQPAQGAAVQGTDTDQTVRAGSDGRTLEFANDAPGKDNNNEVPGKKSAANIDLTIAQPSLKSEHSSGGSPANRAENQSPNHASKTYSKDDEIRLPTHGERLGPYIVGAQIGQGGMGAVYRAIDTRLDREVAIKLLSIGGSRRKELNDRFEREAKAVAAISHPSIVELFDVGVFNDLPYAVMELLHGETLAERLERGRLSANEVRFIGSQIADALATAHHAGVIHRDLKPQNVMLLGAKTRRENEPESDDATKSPSDGQPTLAPSRFEIATNEQLGKGNKQSSRVKVFDFGLSHVSADVMPDDVMDTKAGMVMGTPGYMSPEQVRGESVTEASDIFALGCVLYRSFYGIDPIRGATAAERFANTLTEPDPPDESIVREDQDLADLIARCLSQSLDERPASASEIESLLQQSPQYRDPVMSQLHAGYQSGEIFRRRFLASLSGGVVGALAGFMALPNAISELHQIRSIAVLSLDSDMTGVDGPVGSGPLGSRSLAPGEKLSALLVNELSQLSDVQVRPYRTLSAKNPEDFRRLGNELEVEAFVTGSVTPTLKGGKEFLNVDLKIVSASDGRQLWGHQGIQEVGDNLLEQSKLATDIADKIGRRLTATLQQSPAPKRSSYQCLVDGKVRSDPDSKTGMERALICLNRARDRDPSFVQPVAGIALVSMTLAWQSDAQSTERLVQEAIDAIDKALELNGSYVDARLANAMIQWQTLGSFDKADEELTSLAMLHPYHWQVQHQYGLLQLALGEQNKAMQSLNLASRLNPMSALVKTDVARAAWMSGNAERAITDANLLAEKFAGQESAQRLSRGLLIDIYEHQKQFDKAAELDSGFQMPPQLNQQSYFAQRANRLIALPYGPFGEIMNQTIFDARSPSEMNASYFDSRSDSRSPAFPLLLAVHPTFTVLRQLEIAKDWLA
ncbi:protein kinase domain-containing protein [Planctomycetes bacterium K23_9]|uniref:Serine/threonine-protein kinase PrkC n=1 Tax=Stieleria marina TaxID=1930275 RepID=A0A517NXI4_9BACT|nr:Serine/threonine-protein kinase PrkC [Planctomycetes bacterium K23_9]